MAALPNISGALCSTPQSLADAHYRMPCSNAAKTRTRWNLQGCPKVPDWSHSVLFWQQCNWYVIYFRFVDDAIFAYNGPYGAWLVGRILKMTHRGQHRGRSVMSTIALFILQFFFVTFSVTVLCGRLCYGYPSACWRFKYFLSYRILSCYLLTTETLSVYRRLVAWSSGRASVFGRCPFFRCPALDLQLMGDHLCG